MVQLRFLAPKSLLGFETGFFYETKNCLFMLKHAEKINVPLHVTVSENKLIGFVLEKHFHPPS